MYGISKWKHARQATGKGWAVSENLGRKTIAELEKLINSPDQTDIEIKPNGDIVRLTPEEVVKKNLRIAQETVDVLRAEAVELREGLKRILADLDKLVRP
jgi:hypothetical protein